MKRTLSFLLLWVSVAGAWAGAWPQTTEEDRYGFFLTGSQTRVVIPFEFRSNLIIVSARVNGSDTMRFIVDTGVSYTILASTKRMNRPAGPIVRQLELAGVGEGTAVTAAVSIGNTIRLNGLQANQHTLVLLDKDIMGLSDYAGIPIDGIIGYELFANLVVTIDFQTHKITVVRPENYRYRHRKGDRIPLVIEGNKAYTDSLSVYDGRTFVPLRVVFDTGAGQPLLLDRFKSDGVITMPDRLLRVDLGWGLGGIVTGSMGRLPRIRLGRCVLTNVLASFPDSTHYNRKLATLPTRQGSLGCELLRRFRVTFNYPDHYIVLKPIRRLVREPFESDMSGLQLLVKGNDLCDFVVDRVLANSPAERAGLQPGDELIEVNQYLSRTLSLGDINRLLRAGDNKPVTLVIRRQGRLYHLDFILHRLI